METTHISSEEQKQSESLLENGTTVEIVKTNKIVAKQCSPFCRQLLGCSAPLLCLVAVGNVVGYTSILIRQLKYDDSPITLNSSEESWIASIATVAMGIASILAGILMEKYGRRPLLLNVSAFFFICWMSLSFSVNLYGLLFGRFVTGFCAGFLTSPLAVYISEITQPSYRGLFLSAQGFTTSLGMLMPHALGIYLKWEIVAVICALLPLVCYLLMLMVPESPPWLLGQGRIEEAAEAFTWFRGHNHEAADEFEKMVEGQKLTLLQNNNSGGIPNLLTLARSKSFYKPFLIVFIYFVTLHSSGRNVIAFYTITILKNSLGENVNEYGATIILDVTRVVTSALCCIVVQNFGRRPLTTFSGLGTAATLFGLSIYLYAASKNEELKGLYGIPMTFFTLYIVFITMGLSPLAWTIKSELFPLKYRGTGSAMISFTNSVLTFAYVKTTPSLFAVLGEQGVFFLFGVCCLVGTIYLTIFLPETRNKTLQEIEDTFRKPRPTANLKEINIE